jgi:hypothetical protein
MVYEERIVTLFTCKHPRVQAHVPSLADRQGKRGPSSLWHRNLGCTRNFEVGKEIDWLSVMLVRGFLLDPLANTRASTVPWVIASLPDMTDSLKKLRTKRASILLFIVWRQLLHAIDEKHGASRASLFICIVLWSVFAPNCASPEATGQRNLTRYERAVFTVSVWTASKAQSLSCRLGQRHPS